MRSNIIIAGGLLLFVAIVMTLQERPQRRDSRMVIEKGIVTEVYETSFNDFVLKLKGQAKSYYLDARANRVTLKHLREKLLYKPVVIQYPDRRKSSRKPSTQHYISTVETNGEVVYIDE